MNQYYTRDVQSDDDPQNMLNSDLNLRLNTSPILILFQHHKILNTRNKSKRVIYKRNEAKGNYKSTILRRKRKNCFRIFF